MWLQYISGVKDKEEQAPDKDGWQISHMSSKAAVWGRLTENDSHISGFPALS